MSGRLRGAVYYDWQNSYHRAHDAFHSDGEPSRMGNFRPGAMAELLLSKGGSNRELVRVGIYTGTPDPRRDKKGHRAHERRAAEWRKECGSTLLLRPRTLKYPPDWPRERAREKGVDVQLAIDVVLGAVGGTYDVVVLATTDTDFMPVPEGLKTIREQTGRPEVEVVAWKGVKAGLKTPGVRVTWIGDRDYQMVQDTRDYNV